MTDSTDMRELPIGVFDSGVGGLTVLKALAEELPGESFVYLGDTARVPYGNKSGETVARYSTNIASALVERGCKALVIACNTASAFAYEAVKRSVNVPVVDVVRPVAHEVATLTQGTIVVLGTRGTVKSNAYLRAIREFDAARKIIQTACPLFVPLAEEGWTEGEVPRAIVTRYLEDICSQEIPSQIILGCTHYPLLAETISATLKELLETPPSLHDSGQSTARRLRAMLEARNLHAREASRPPRWLVTDGPESFEAVAARFLGYEITDVEHIDLTDRGYAQHPKS